MIDAKRIHEIAKDVVAKEYDFDHIGIRVQESDYGVQVGQQIDHCSHHWDDGEMMDEEINGICAVNAHLAAEYNLQFGAYSGDTILVLGSNSSEHGEDDGEIILKSTYGSPTVLDIIKEAR